MSLVDLHTHLPSAAAPAWASWRQSDALAELDRFGIARAAVMTLDGLAYDAVTGNDVVAQVCAGSDGRLLPFGSVDPRRPDAADELRRCADRGFHAIKLHPWMQGFSPLEAYMDPVAEAAIERGLPFVMHDGTPPYASPLQIARLAARFPELTVVLAHGGLFDLWEDSVAAAVRYPNVHITMCGTAPRAVFREIVRRVPVAKLTLGTDGGFGDPDLRRHRLSVHRAILAELPDGDAAALAYRNAERLLGLT
ncbi:amidohydrolase family protein [Jiangella anatolica]|uniref:Amidohydrolase n=1 Tax=Jiangella anatolica TaxID=2670374 RepID=A0A2W2B9K1_9ACTN|nr:amidohydrolase family protein [Jiangella anatolica]PZF84231.1 amidohydrolase [Jiangella anatolica]